MLPFPPNTAPLATVTAEFVNVLLSVNVPAATLVVPVYVVVAPLANVRLPVPVFVSANVPRIETPAATLPDLTDKAEVAAAPLIVPAVALSTLMLLEPAP